MPKALLPWRCLLFVSSQCTLNWFVGRLLLIAIETALGLRSRVWAIGVLLLVSPLFVLPVLTFMDPSMRDQRYSPPQAVGS